MRKILFLVAFILFGIQAHATITINGFTGVSNYVIKQNQTQPSTPGGTTTPAAGSSGADVYGGFAGWDSVANTAGPGCLASELSTAQTCDSCKAAVCQDSQATPVAQTPLCACNRARASNALTIGVQIGQSAAPVNVRAYGTVTGQTAPVELNILASGTTGVSFAWSEVCRLFSGTADCENITAQSASVTVNVYLDKDGSQTYTSGEEQIPINFHIANPGRTNYNVFGSGASDGVGDFTPWPGDDRVYLKYINTTTTFPTLGGYGEKVNSIKVYLSKTDLSKATPVGNDFEGSLDVDSTGAVGQDYVDGPENGTVYYMRLAMQDTAGNIVAFFPDLAATDAKGAAHPTCFTPTTPDSCPFAVKPDQVLGILSKDFNCFIASAAYGTSLEPKLNLFRRFRSDILLRYAWGRAFVWQYYAYGPYAARYISDKPVLRAMVRGLLWPLAGYSWLALKIGLVRSLIFCLGVFALLISLPWLATRRRAARA